MANTSSYTVSRLYVIDRGGVNHLIHFFSGELSFVLELSPGGIGRLGVLRRELGFADGRLPPSVAVAPPVRR